MNFNPATENFWDEKALHTNMERIFDICHGCRRCFNLCPSFAGLFNALDEEQVDGDVKKLNPLDHKKIVDDCYYCKLCFNHCPYTPPHHYDLDFPRLMIQAKIQNAKKTPPRLKDRILVDIDRTGKMASRVAPLVNWGNRLRWVRLLIEKTLGIHRDRLMAPFSFQTFKQWFESRKTGGSSKKNKVVLFYTCFVNYNDPEIGKAAVDVLEKNGFEVLAPSQQCCGMPFFDTGEIDKVLSKGTSNLEEMAKWVEQGFDIVIPMPTCSLMFKKEYPDLYQNEISRKVASRTYDLSEFLIKLHKEGKLSLDFKQENMGKIAYQVPCHLRDQNIGYKSRDLLRLIPGTQIEVIEKCSGHDGTWGIKTGFFNASMKIGRPLFRNIEEVNPDRVMSDCPLAGVQIEQGTGKKSSHPIQIFNEAYKKKC
ncbi:MAG: anaerobic glycerol-3-phosphate dehydrogenase subunit C [Nitrospiria bacterium]